MVRFRKGTALMVCLAMLCTCVGAVAQGYTAGDYTAAAQGMNGEVSVKVAFTQSEISAVEVTAHAETEGIGTTAVERIPGEIVAYQSLAVDAVSGATLTSNAILTAVADCVAQAGGDVEALKAKTVEKEPLEDETVETDVVVVGGGIAGLSAAIQAANAGAKVVLLEKMGAVGGSSITCGGEVLAAGTQMQAAQGIADSADSLAELWLTAGEGHVNEDILRYVAEHSADTIDFMLENGVEFAGVTTPTSYPWQNPMRCHKTTAGSGAGFILPMAESAQKLGVDIRVETAATDLIRADGKVTGVVASNAGRTVTVHAGSVVLATGGYGNNQDLMNEYALAEVPRYGMGVGEANQGDGLVMARDAGAEIVGTGAGIALALDMNASYWFEPYGRYLYVSPEGERFMDESAYWFVRTRKLYDMGGYCYLMADSKDDLHDWPTLAQEGKAVSGGSLEELAAAMGVDAAILSKTVETYNGWCAAGQDEEFGKLARNVDKYADATGVEAFDMLTALDAPPYYAMELRLQSLSGTFGGPRVTLKGEVVSTEGDVIPGLYAAGEVANGDLYYLSYPCSGSAIQLYCSMGRYAGEAAAERALAK